eukprot:11881944-Prorocentrum_lima.AAC.1
MTSSLVGSEMCIRDSLYADDTACFSTKRDLLEATLRTIERISASYGPVSYTHLTLPTICSV